MLIPPVVERRLVESNPRLIWDTFVNFISQADTREMNDIQMAAQLPFWYDSEVRREGHLGYFENSYTRMEDKLNVLIMATLDALRIIQAERQAVILQGASDLYFSRPRPHFRSPEEIKALNARGEFAEADREFQQAAPDITFLLQSYVNAHLNNFVNLVG